MTPATRLFLLVISIVIFLVAAVLSFILAGGTSGPTLPHVLDVLGVYGVGFGFFAAAHIP